MARKMKPYSMFSDSVSGKRTRLVHIDQFSQDGFGVDHFNNAKRIRSLRKQMRVLRNKEKSSARQRMKQQLKFELHK